MNQTGAVACTLRTPIHSTTARRLRFFFGLSRPIAAGALALAFLAGAVRTHAQTTSSWVSASGTFSGAANWSPAGEPAAEGVIVFTNNVGADFTVSLDANTPTLSSAVVSNQTGVVTLNPNGFTWLVTNRFTIGRGSSTTTVYMAGGTLSVCQLGGVYTGAVLRIADATTNLFNCVATMIVTNGTLAVDSCVIGAASNSVGTLVIAGPGKYWRGPNDLGTLTVGGSSENNRLIVTNGAKMTVYSNFRVGSSLNASNNFFLIRDPGSAGTIEADGITMSGNGGLTVISNDASFFLGTGGTIGANSSFNTCLVDHATLYSAPGNNFQVGVNSSGGTNNNLTVQNGSVFTCNGTLAYGNNVYHVNDGINIGGPGLPSVGFAMVVRSTSATTNHYGGYVTVTNAFFSCNYLSPQAPQETITVAADGTWQVTNSFAINGTATSGGTNGVILRGPSTSLIINGGTMINQFTADNGGGIVVGNGTLNTGDSLIITNGGQLLTSGGTIGAGGQFTTGMVVGASSEWQNFVPAGGTNFSIIVGTGDAGSNNFLGVFDGGTLYNDGSLVIGNNGFTAVVNTVCFGGPGALSIIVNNGSLNIGAGHGSYSNALVVTNATLNCGTINVGNSDATNNLLQFNGGQIAASFVRIRPTNTVVFTAGTLSVGGLTFDTLANNSNAFVVGDGVHAAYYDMAAGGSGYHNFNNGGLVVTNSAFLRGTGTLAGNVTVLGTFAPGFSVGSVFASNNLIFGSAAVLNYDLGTLSDSVTVTNNLGLGGTLNITNSGGFGVGNYTIFSYGGVLTNNGTLTVGIKPLPSLTYVINTNTVGSVVLQVTTGAVDPWTAWDTHYFPGDGPNAAGNVDVDGVGMNNTNKFLAGFNPTNSAAYLHIISIARSAGTNIVVTYLGANGDNTWSPGIAMRTNVLDFTTGLSNGSYATNNFASTGQTNILMSGSGSGTITSFVDTNGASSTPSRYYRVRVLLP